MKRALISVSDKQHIETLGKAFVANGVEIISTGGTQTYLRELGIPTIGIEEVTHFPEMLDGRVKTLHPAIHGGLLGKRDNIDHEKILKQHHIQWIDFVCVNLYPFKETVTQPNISTEEAIEQIDIGGPSMLRSGAKNFQDVTVICDPRDYEKVIEELTAYNGTKLETRKRLAYKAFQHTASYDALISRYFQVQLNEQFPDKLTVTYDKKETLRYGENSQQQASLYEEPFADSSQLVKATQLHGKSLSYNNLKDANAALTMVKEFNKPAVVAVKHMNPCGVGIGKDGYEAYRRAYEADSTSIFGGIIACNQEIDVKTSEDMHSIFLEIILAPSFSNEALEILKQKKNIRLIQVPLEAEENQLANDLELVSIDGGLLVQEKDQGSVDVTDWQIVTEKKPTSTQLQALEFGFKVVKHVKSNAIVLTTDKQTVGIGAGQMNRIGSVKIAVSQAEEQLTDLSQVVLASDAFFPMDDCVSYAAAHGIQAIVQPGGSLKDQESIDKANELGITMVFTGQRHFRH